MPKDRNGSLPREEDDDGAEERHRHRRSKRKKEEINDGEPSEPPDEKERDGGKKRRKRGKHHRESHRGSRRSRGSSSGSEEDEDSSTSASFSDSSSEDSSGASDSEESEGEVRRRKRRERRRKEREHEKEKRRREKERRRRKARDEEKRKKEKAKKKKEKKEKDLGKKGAVTNSWGKYGVIRETDMWNKRPEFTAWLADVKKVNLESLANWEEKQMFKEFMEDHNTATFPSKKYYGLDAYHQHMMAKEMKKGIKKASGGERTIFNDEELRRQELLIERERQKDEQVEVLKRSMQSGMAQAMKEQAQLKEEMAYQYKVGNLEAAHAIQRRLDPDTAM